MSEVNQVWEVSHFGKVGQVTEVWEGKFGEIGGLGLVS